MLTFCIEFENEVGFVRGPRNRRAPLEFESPYLQIRSGVPQLDAAPIHEQFILMERSRATSRFAGKN